jgi:hypothetical protein
MKARTIRASSNHSGCELTAKCFFRIIKERAFKCAGNIITESSGQEWEKTVHEGFHCSGTPSLR